MIWCSERVKKHWKKIPFSKADISQKKPQKNPPRVELSIKAVGNSYINIGLSADVIWHCSSEVRGGEELPLWPWIFCNLYLQALLIQQSPSCTLTLNCSSCPGGDTKSVEQGPHGASQVTRPPHFSTLGWRSGLYQRLRASRCSTALCPDIFLDYQGA